MALLPRIPEKPGRLVHRLLRLVQPKRPTHPARADKDANIRLWRGRLLSSEETLRQLDLSAIGVPEAETDAELCLVKGEVLRRAGHDHDAQRFLRQAPRLSRTHRSASAMALRAAPLDSGFQRIVGGADRARDAEAWGEADDLYNEAVRAYPDHYGYVVQHAHCLKEQGRFAEAECHYRSALALGAPRSDVDEHLMFVATQQGFPANFVGVGDTAVEGDDPLDAPLTKADVEFVACLLLGREMKATEIVQLMRKHRTLRSLILAVVEDGSFVAANPHLLSAAKRWSAPSALRSDPSVL
jgi:tetratricopeptide (TPR) repeat protein